MNSSTSLRRGALAAGLASIMCASLAACGDSGGGGDGESSELRIALPTGVTSFANSDVVVADELGYFDDVGLTVTLTNLRSGSSVTTGVVGGEFEIGGASIEPVINAFAGGGTVQIIGSYTDRLEVEMVTPEDITSVEDLRGQSLGIQEIGAFREVMTRMVLEGAAMTPDDVSYVSVGADAYVSALVQRQIASAILHPEQRIQAQQEDATLHSLINLYEVEPDYYYGTYFTSDSWLEENPEAAAAFTEAITRAHRTMYADRETVVPIIAEATGKSEDIIDQAWEVYMEQVCAFPVNEGLDADRLDYTLQRMGEMATLAEGAQVDMNELVDRGPIETAVENLGQADERCGG